MFSTAHGIAGVARIRRMGSAAALAAAVLLLTGCGSSGTRPAAKPSGALAAGPSSPDPTAAAEQQVLAAYKGMVDAQVRGYAAGTFQNADIERYASEKALAAAKDTLFVDLRNGIVMKGAPTFQVMKTTVDLSSRPYRARLTVCWDDAGWTPVNEETGKSVAAPGEQRRYVATSMLRTIGDRWVVIDGTADRAKTC